MSTIAFLGTGLLGGAFVEAACQRGDTISAWNRTAAKAKALETFGARCAATPAEAVQGAERVHLVLTDDAVVEDVIAQCRGALAKNAIIVDHSTTLPAKTAERSVRLNKEGVQYLHCPVFIGPPAARQSQGTILAAGRRDLFEQVKPALERQAARVEYFGERPDLAAVYKLMGNALILSFTGLLSDVFSVGAANGVSAPDAMKMFDWFNVPGMIQVRGRNMSNGNFDATFELTMARKDIRLMMETAGTLPLTVLPGMAARMDTLIAAGYGDKDTGVVAIDAVRAGARHATQP